MFKSAKDPISSLTHFIGTLFSFVGLIVIILMNIILRVDKPMFIGTIIFCFSMIALYLSSSLYHYYSGNKEMILKKIDHSMIYVLIAGTYTPIVLYCMEAPKSYYFLLMLWFIVLIGVIMKIIWINAPRLLSTLIYLLLGWSVLFDFQSFLQLPVYIFILIALGGISYSIGAIIYIIKKPNLSTEFGFHELFHIFVMIGTFFHYISIVLLIL